MIPLLNPLTEEVGELTLPNEPVPAITDQVPMAGDVGAAAAMVEELLGKHIV